MYEVIIPEAIKDRRDVKELMPAYEDFAREMAALIEDEYGETPRVLVEASDTRGNTSYRVFIKIPSKKNPVIAVRRRLRKDSLYQNLFEIDERLQGRGIAKKLHKAQLAAAKAAGIKRYAVNANLDVGGYAWLRTGYKPDSYYEIIMSMVDDGTSGAYGRKFEAEIERIYNSGDDEAAEKFIKKQLAARNKDLFLGTSWSGGVDVDDPDFNKWVGYSPKPRGIPNPIQLASRHSVFLTQRAGKVHNELIKVMREAERQVLARVGNTDWQDERNSTVLKDVQRIKKLAWKKWRKGLDDEIKEFVDYETGYANEFLDSLVPVQTNYAAPEAVLTAIEIEPLTVDHNGGQDTLQGFMDDWEQKDIQAVTRAIRGGIASSATRQEMIAMVKGLSPATTKSARTIVRTSLNHVSSTARDKVYRENKDIVNGFEIVATLDRRTTSKCRGLDGHKFAWGDHPILRPPFHPGCRTTTIPWLIDKFDIFNTGATRASMDGPVPADQTYYGWLKEEPFEVQKSIIGLNRAKLLSDGGLTAEQFRNLSVDEMFEPLTLDEMARRDREFGYGAFKRAGVEPRTQTA